MREPKTFERMTATTVRAIQWTGQNLDAITAFGARVVVNNDGLHLYHLVGRVWLPLEVGDWIAHDGDGHRFYRIKDDGDRPRDCYEVEYPLCTTVIHDHPHACNWYYRCPHVEECRAEPPRCMAEEAMA